MFKRNKDTEETNEIKAAIEASKPKLETDIIEPAAEHTIDPDSVIEGSTIETPVKPAPLASRNKGYEEVAAGGLTFKRKTGAVYDYSQQRTLDIPEDAKDNSLYYRFINDDRGRLEKALSNGYAKIDDLTDPTTGQPIATKHRVGTKQDGSALYAHLVATPKKWRDERKAQAEKARYEKETGLMRSLNDGDSALGSEFYVKNSTQIEDNNKVKI